MYRNRTLTHSISGTTNSYTNGYYTGTWLAIFISMDRLYNLMARKLAGEATPEELAELTELLQQHPDASTSMEVLSAFWQQSLSTPQAETDKAFARHLQRLAATDK